MNEVIDYVNGNENEVYQDMDWYYMKTDDRKRSIKFIFTGRTLL